MVLTAGGGGSIPDPGTKIPHDMQSKKKKKKKHKANKHWSKVYYFNKRITITTNIKK